MFETGEGFFVIRILEMRARTAAFPAGRTAAFPAGRTAAFPAGRTPAFPRV